MSKKILVLDYKTGNVDSIIKAIKILGYNPLFSSERKKIDECSKIILPGQGSYSHAIQELKRLDLLNDLQYKIKKNGIPVLGICLGMQILSTSGDEGFEQSGLNLIPGRVKILKKIPNKLPHLGWNTVNFEIEDKLFNKIENNKDFYFIHSYYFECEDKNNIIGKTNYNQSFASIVKKSNIYGVQFHPEKSLKNGLKILENFLKLNE
jgi:imidazole glycerol-phosphate synthase subunit HisH